MRAVLLLAVVCLAGSPARAQDHPYLVEMAWQLTDFTTYEPEDHWNQWRAVEGWSRITATFLQDTSLMSPLGQRQHHPVAELSFDAVLGYTLRQRQNMEGSTFADRGVPGWTVRSGRSVLSSGTGDASTSQSFSAGLRFIDTEMVFSLGMYEVQESGLAMYSVEEYDVPFVPSFWYDAEVEPVEGQENQYRLTVTRYPQGPEAAGISQEWIVDRAPVYLAYSLAGDAVVEVWGTGVTEAYSKPLRYWRLCRDTDQDKLHIALRPTLNRAALLVEHGGLNGRLHNVRFEHTITSAVWTYPWGTVSVAEGTWDDSDYRGNTSRNDPGRSEWDPPEGGQVSFWTYCEPGYSTGLQFYQTANLMP